MDRSPRSSGRRRRERVQPVQGDRSPQPPRCPRPPLAPLAAPSEAPDLPKSPESAGWPLRPAPQDASCRRFPRRTRTPSWKASRWADPLQARTSHRGRWPSPRPTHGGLQVGRGGDGVTPARPAGGALGLDGGWSGPSSLWPPRPRGRDGVSSLELFHEGNEAEPGCRLTSQGRVSVEDSEVCGPHTRTGHMVT